MAPEEITKVQELIYTTRVEAVMARDVIVTTPTSTMEEVRDLLRDNRISGVPVVENGRMVGVVSMSDVMDAVAEGGLDTPAHQHMTTDVTFIQQGASVFEAVNGLGRHGHNRLPVVDENDKLVGIVTTGTIIRSLLQQMETSFKKKEEEKLYTYRASHIFDDIVSDDTSLVLRYVIDDKDFDRAGHASSMIKKSLQRLRIQPSIVRRVAVAVYEAEMNLVIHTDVGGEITVQIYKDRVNISTVDHGPGIEDVAKVLQPGYSTAPEWIRDMGFGAGMGLANIRRCSDVMKLMSEAGVATRLDITFRIPRSPEGDKKSD